MKNEFSEETRSLFIFIDKCFICNQNGWDAGHHILGRESTSPLNFCPVHNMKCHIGNGKLLTFEMRQHLLKKTLKYLLSVKYKLTKQDKEFMKKNNLYYV
jgi:hypothetical protein